MLHCTACTSIWLSSMAFDLITMLASMHVLICSDMLHRMQLEKSVHLISRALAHYQDPVRDQVMPVQLSIYEVHAGIPVRRSCRS